MAVELLEGTPANEVQQPVLAEVESAFIEFGLTDAQVRMTKVGPKLYVEVEGQADSGMTIEEEHRIRCDLERRLDTLPYEVWLNFELSPRPEGV